MAKGPAPKSFDKEQFELLCAFQGTEEEIAAIFRTSRPTLEKWCKREYGKNFSEVFAEKRLAGKYSLRRMQWALAKKSAAMAIFLGKNYLGQTDKQDVEFSGKIDLTLSDLVLSAYDESHADDKSS